MSRRTPGPWKAQVYYTSHRLNEGEIDIDDRNGLHVATVKYGEANRPAGLETATANARLIAAAPELLEACRGFRDALLRIDYEAIAGMERIALDAANRAIAKAEGADA